MSFLAFAAIPTDTPMIIPATANELKHTIPKIIKIIIVFFDSTALCFGKHSEQINSLKEFTPLFPSLK